MTSPDARPKVIGVGLNKTGTKTLRTLLEQWGYQHCYEYQEAFKLYQASRFDDLVSLMEPYDSFEDWPWPLAIDELDRAYPDARFILTTRASTDDWYRSLCRMAVRIGPLNEYEPHIYGTSMPQRDPDGHRSFYENHNAEVRERFADRPDRFLELCWDEPEALDQLAAFLGEQPPATAPHENRGRAVYGGSNVALAWSALIAHRLRKRARRLVGRS